MIRGVTMQEEIWRPIICQDIHRGWYEVSNLGNVRTTSTKRLLHPFLSKGYLRIGLMTYDRGQQKFPVHRLVAIAFVPGRTDDKRFVNHIDGNKTHNEDTNLEWVTASENTIHAISTGLLKVVKGEQNGQATITEEDAHYICQVLLETNGNVPKTYEIVKNKIPAVSSAGLIYHIKKKSTWLHISDLYFQPEDFDSSSIYHNNVVSFVYNKTTIICGRLSVAAIYIHKLSTDNISISSAHNQLLNHEYNIGGISIKYYQ